MRRSGEPWTLAAPSCVLRAGVAENCATLALDYGEVSLAFFETDACLAYTVKDLPPRLADLPLRYSVHLPFDLPWSKGTAAVANVVLALAERAGFLRPWAYVLHPPRRPETLARLAELLASGGIAPGRILVENIRERDLAELWPAIEAAGLGVCLDLGHMLVHRQEAFLDMPGLAGRVRMVHLNAPDPARPGRHASLRLLDARGRALMGRLVDLTPPEGSVELELFSPEELGESRACLAEYLADGVEEPAA